jgi:hypothetical protein
MRKWNYDAPKMAHAVRVSYFWSLIDQDGSDMFGPQRVRLWELRSLRECKAELLAKGFRLAVSRRVEVWPVEACHYCQARPCVTEWDCDGSYLRAICDDPQCNRGNNVDNSDWVAGTGPLWGPEHPEWPTDAIAA